MKKLLCALTLLVAVSSPVAAQAPTLEVEHSGVALRGGRFHVKLTADGFAPGTPATVLIDGRAVQQINLAHGEQTIVIDTVKPTGNGQTVQVWTQNAAFIWVPWILLASLAAWFGMNDIADVKASFATQATIFRRPII